jgi:hypothetical protein
MGMTRFGARKRLQRLEVASGEAILRQVGNRWEVSSEALKRALSEPERRVDDLAETVAVHGERIEALRRVGVKFRRETKAQFEKHAKVIRMLAEANKAATDAITEAMGLTNSNERQRTATGAQ